MKFVSGCGVVSETKTSEDLFAPRIARDENHFGAQVSFSVHNEYLRVRNSVKSFQKNQRFDVQ